ncbi:MAG: hydrogenase maturation protease [Gemmataceae bacterium]|nr:hydrogenase maturation protease [Gemmata sp.]MDW8196844.1 hydrogenase maturation protease [Gemmataceae bacterium]
MAQGYADATPRPTAIIGLGSPFGDDRVGWEVIAQLQSVLPAGCWSQATADPLQLLEIPSHYRRWIVVDASRGGGRPGQIQRFAWPDDRLIATRTASSHGFDLVAALAWAATLGRLPPQVIIFTIELAVAGAEPERALSEPVAAAIPVVVARIVAETVGEETMHEEKRPCMNR